MFFQITIGFLSLLGLGLFLYFANAIVKEVWRTARQSHRLARAQERMMKMNGHTPPSFSLMWHTYFKSDFFAFYSSKRIGCFELDYDPSKRVRAYR